MEQKEIILRSLATFTSILIIFALILTIASEQSPWGYKSIMIATGFSIFSTIFWWTTTSHIFKE